MDAAELKRRVKAMKDEAESLLSDPALPPFAETDLNVISEHLTLLGIELGLDIE